MIKLFEKTPSGLLMEVPTEQAAQARIGRRTSRTVNAEYDVLWTPEEETARDAEEAAISAQQEASANLAAKQAQKRTAALDKLRTLGLSEDDIASLGL